jgi:hypothetical protein
LQKSVYKSVDGAVAAMVIGLIVFCMFAMFGQQKAYADYVIDELESNVAVQTTGALNVSERRSYVFEEATSAVRFEVSGLTSTAKLTSAAVRLADDASDGAAVEWQSLAQVKFQTAWRGIFGGTSGATKDYDKYIANRTSVSNAAEAYFESPTPGTWALDETTSIIYIFLPEQYSAADTSAGQSASDADGSSHLARRALIECDYTAEQAVMAFDDVAELYFDYVPSTGDAVIENVKTTFTLPVPANAAVVPGDNVLAWGHGAAGSFGVYDDGSIVYSCERINAGQYCQAHILFPQSWLTNLTVTQKWAYSGTRLASATAEEASWTDSWTASRINAYTLLIVSSGICLVCVALALVVFVATRRRVHSGGEVDADEVAITFANLTSDISTFTKVLGGCAVLGRLRHGDHKRIEDFVSCIVELVASGVLAARRLDEGDVELALKSKVGGLSLAGYQRKMCSFLMGTVGGDFDVVRVSDIVAYADSARDEFRRFLDEWQTELDSQVELCGLFDHRSRRTQKKLAIFAAVVAIVGVIARLIGLDWLIFGEFILSAAVIAVLANYTFAMTPKGSASDAAACELYTHLLATDKIQNGDSQAQLDLLLFAFQFNTERVPFDKIACPGTDATLFFGPTIGKGGRREAAFIQKFAMDLEKRSS